MWAVMGRAANAAPLVNAHVCVWPNSRTIAGGRGNWGILNVGHSIFLIFRASQLFILLLLLLSLFVILYVIRQRTAAAW